MDGLQRLKRCAILGLFAAIGCQNTSKFTPPAAAVTPSAAKPSLLSRVFPPKPPGPTTVATSSEAPAKKGPLKPETIVAFADAQVNAVFESPEDGLAPQQERTLDEARFKYQHVLQSDPNNREALLGMARLYTRLGNRERAMGFYDQLAKLYPADHKAIYERSLACGRFDDWDGAIASCQQALAADPENRRYRKTLGIATARAGRMEDGFRTLMTVMNEAEARFTMAKLMVDNGQPELVQQQLQLASHADPSYAPAREWLNQMQGQAQQPVQQADYRQPAAGSN